MQPGCLPEALGQSAPPTEVAYKPSMFVAAQNAFLDACVKQVRSTRLTVSAAATQISQQPALVPADSGMVLQARITQLTSLLSPQPHVHVPTPHLVSRHSRQPQRVGSPPAVRRCRRSRVQRAFASTEQQARPAEIIKPIKEFGYGRDLLERYELGEQIGKGSFGVVHIATDRRTGEKVAVKTMVKRFGPDGLLEPNFVRRVQHEVDIMQHLGSSLNMAYCYGAYEEAKCVGLVMELLTGGELFSRIRAEHYSEKEAARIVREILRTVAQCHSRRVILRDVKPENFLFLNESEHSGLRAIDFGLAEYCEPGQYLTDRAGTVIYIAPEVLRNKYTLSADLWSVGIIAYLLLTGRLPFAGEEGEEVSELFVRKQIFQNRAVFRAVLYADLDFESPPWDTLSEDARNLVQALLNRDPDKRPQALEALHFRWLQEDGKGASSQPLASSIVQRLQRFGTFGRLKQVALRAIAHNFGADGELLAEMRDMFNAIDTDGSGTITHEEMEKALKSGQWNLSDSEVSQLLAQLEVTPEGEFDYGDWLAALIDWREFQESSEWDDWVRAAFEAFDVDGSGRLSTESLNKLLCGDTCAVADTVEAALREADIDHDGTIGLADFEALMRSPSAEDLELFNTGLSSDSEDYLLEDSQD